MLSDQAANTNLKVFGLPLPCIELTTSCTRGEHATMTLPRRLCITDANVFGSFISFTLQFQETFHLKVCKENICCKTCYTLYIFTFPPTIAICKKFNNKKEAKTLFILTITPVTRLIDDDTVMDNHPNVN